MVRVASEIEINAPVEAVWDVMQNPSRRGEWDFRITGGRFTKEGYPTKGATFSVSGRLMLPYHFDIEYLIVTPYRQTIVRLIQAYGLPIRSGAGSWTYMRDGADKTVVRSAFRFELAPPWNWLVEKWLFTPIMYLITKRSLLQLKRLVEQEQKHMTKTR